MQKRVAFAVCLVIPVVFAQRDVLACCATGLKGKPVVNADQTVIIIWDAESRTQHFIRRASFKSAGRDFAFIIPSPGQPTLSESGGKAFSFLKKLTAPKKEWRMRPMPFIGACKSKMATPRRGVRPVRVLDEKTVAGFDAVVLEADSSDALVGWLRKHGYEFSTDVERWAAPYIHKKWKFTALKVAKSAKEDTLLDVSAAPLRMTFQTDRPLFPYREPRSEKSASDLGAADRLLRIYFVAEARYRGKTEEATWPGRAVWAHPLSENQRTEFLNKLGLPQDTGPTKFFVTEFEDEWTYRDWKSDVYFTRSPEQETITRHPIVTYGPAVLDLAALALCGIIIVLLGWRVRRAMAAR